MKWTVPLLLLLSVAGCGPEDPPPPRRPVGVPALLAEIGPDGVVAPFDFLGHHVGEVGATALVAHLGVLVAGDDPAVERALAALSRIVRPEEPRPVLDEALALLALSIAREYRWPTARKLGLLPAVVRLRERLEGRRRADGGFGDAVETAWAAYALAVTGESTGRERLEPLAAAEERAAADGGPARGTDLEQIHRCVTYVIARELAPWRKPPPRVQDTARWLLAGIPHDGPPDLLAARALCWWTIRAAIGATHPEAGTRTSFRRRYEAGDLAARTRGEQVALTLALEYLGYDSFGSILGYLPDCRWTAR